MIKVPENHYRKVLAGAYMKEFIGKPEEDIIKKAVNGSNGEEKSLEYYLGCENIINITIQAFGGMDQKQIGSAGFTFSSMLTYISYEIERLSAFKDRD